MNSAIASNINGSVINQKVVNGSHSSVLLSSIEFAVTETKTNFTATSQGKYFYKMIGKQEIFNGQKKVKNGDQNKNPLENSHSSLNGNIEIDQEDSIPVPKLQLYTGKINVEWNQVHKIGAGLNNLGNTCFMNTVIQCLTYCPPLANYLLHDNDHASKCSITGFCMMCLLQKHMRRTIGKTGEVVKPIDVYQRLKLIAKHFQFGRQEDAHEFLRYVIDNLWKSCLPQNSGAKLDPASKETTVINKIFGGYHRSQVICLKCNKRSNTFDHFMEFMLDIRQNVVSLEKALEKFIQPELLQQDNCYKCPKCKMKVEAQKSFTVYRAPTVATFQFKRFDYYRSFGGKITKQISYPEKLNLRPYMSESQGEPVWYHLNAVLVHSGPTCNSGHYYCYVKNSNGLWYIMDDSRVHQVSLNQVLNQCAYVLFYIKIETGERAPLKKCIENRNLVKGPISNSPYHKVPDIGSSKIPMGNKPSLGSPKYSPNNLLSKKYNLPAVQNREKVSFGFRPNGASLSSSSPNLNSKVLSSSQATASSTQNGLVPYVEDSSESSDVSECGITNNSNTNNADKQGTCVNSENNPKTSSLESYKMSPRLEIRAKLSKPVFNKSVSPNSCSPTPNVKGISNLTDKNSSFSSVSNSDSGLSLDQHIDITLTPNKSDSSKDCNENELGNSPEILILPTSSKPSNMGQQETSTNSADGMSAENCNFRKQLFKSKSEGEETDKFSFKRKYSDSNGKIPQESPKPQYSENRHSPLSKKAKYAEKPIVPMQNNGLNSKSEFVNGIAKQNDCISSNSHKTQIQSHTFEKSYKDISGSSVKQDRSVDHSERRLNTSWPSNSLNYRKEAKEKTNKDLSVEGKSHKNYSESPTPSVFEKKLSSTFDFPRNSSLYGVDIPTWKNGKHYRPSLPSAHENRIKFSSYDEDFDRGKVRKHKTKHQNYHFHKQKNPFQSYSDRFHNSLKYNGKFYNDHRNYRNYDSHYNWKSKHNGNGQKYKNHHRRRY